MDGWIDGWMEHRVIPFKRKQQNGTTDGEVWRRGRVQDLEVSNGKNSSQSLFSDVYRSHIFFTQAGMSGQIKKSRSVFYVIVKRGSLQVNLPYVNMLVFTHT